jgi:hypothetical protein
LCVVEIAINARFVCVPGADFCPFARLLFRCGSNRRPESLLTAVGRHQIALMRNGFQFEAHLTSFVLMTLEFLVIFVCYLCRLPRKSLHALGRQCDFFYVGDDSLVQFVSQIIKATSYEKFSMLQPIFADLK